MVSDTERLLAMLCDRFGTPAVVAGFSMGATLAALAARSPARQRRPLLRWAWTSTAPPPVRNAYEFALATAQARKVRRAIRRLQAIGPTPHLEPKEFATLERWATNFGGVRSGQTYNSMVRSLLVSLLRSCDYSLADAVPNLAGHHGGASACCRSWRP